MEGPRWDFSCFLPLLCFIYMYMYLACPLGCWRGHRVGGWREFRLDLPGRGSAGAEGWGATRVRVALLVMVASIDVGLFVGRVCVRAGGWCGGAGVGLAGCRLAGSGCVDGWMDGGGQGRGFFLSC